MGTGMMNSDKEHSHDDNQADSRPWSATNSAEAATRPRGSLAARIERQIRERAGLFVAVEVRGDTMVLSGLVDTPEARQAAEDIASELAPDWRIDNDLNVEATQPPEVEAFTARAGETAPWEPSDSLEELRGRGAEYEPDFTDTSETTDVAEVIQGTSADQPFAPLHRPSQDADNTYFAAADPVIRTDTSQQGIDLLGGFSETSLDTVEVEPSAEGARFGDEAIAEAVERELREDAATHDLDITVEVLNSVAYLRGRVSTLQDVDNAEEVLPAFRVSRKSSSSSR